MISLALCCKLLVLAPMAADLPIAVLQYEAEKHTGKKIAMARLRKMRRV